MSFLHLYVLGICRQKCPNNFSSTRNSNLEGTCVPSNEKTHWACFKSLPNDKIRDWPKVKAFADDKMKLAKMIIFVFDRDENIVGKGENACYQHFLLFQNVFKRLLTNTSR